MVYVDIISGFLGAGKTTFANILLKHYTDNGERTIFIVNEFGDTGLDATITNSAGFKSIEMSNGCVCCSLIGDIEFTLQQVIKEYNPTRIVFEPSGIFVFDNFLEILQSEKLKNVCKIGSIITIVDTVNFTLSRARYGGFIHNQIAKAPVIILSKTEQAGDYLNDVICDVSNINPIAYLFTDVWNKLNGKVLEDILAIKYIDFKDSNQVKINKHTAFKTYTVKLEGDYTKSKIDKFIELYKNNVFGNIYRIKGIISIDGEINLINISADDVRIEKFKFPAQMAITFIGEILDTELINNFWI